MTKATLTREQRDVIVQELTGILYSDTETLQDTLRNPIDREEVDRERMNVECALALLEELDYFSGIPGSQDKDAYTVFDRTEASKQAALRIHARALDEYEHESAIALEGFSESVTETRKANGCTEQEDQERRDEAKLMARDARKAVKACNALLGQLRDVEPLGGFAVAAGAAA